MRPITFIASMLIFGFFTGITYAQKQKKHLARVKRNADGTITELKEIDDRTIERTTLREKSNKERIVSSKSIYVMDDNGVLRECKISDGQGKLLFTVRYGYNRSTGRLIAEAMFDERAKNYNEKGQEIPVQRLYYKYNAHGQRSKPFAITSVGKKRVEEVTSWNKHIQERLNKIEAGYTDSTFISEAERRALQNPSR